MKSNEIVWYMYYETRGTENFLTLSVLDISLQLKAKSVWLSDNFNYDVQVKYID